MKLYEGKITGETGKMTTHVVAISAEQAGDIVKDHYYAVGERLTKASIARIDDKLQGRELLNLDGILERAPIGFATYCNPIGWIAATSDCPTLKIFKVEDEDGDLAFVIAKDANIASSIYFSQIEQADGEFCAVRIYDTLADLTPERTANIAELLEFGTPGIAEFDDLRGWFVR